MGRRKLGETVQVRLPADLIATLDAQAAVDGISRAEIVRRLLVAAVSPAGRVRRP